MGTNSSSLSKSGGKAPTEIHVHQLDGSVITVSGTHTMTVWMLKRQLEAETGVKALRQNLLVHSQENRDSQELVDKDLLRSRAIAERCDPSSGVLRLSLLIGAIDVWDREKSCFSNMISDDGLTVTGQSGCRACFGSSEIGWVRQKGLAEKHYSRSVSWTVRFDKHVGIICGLADVAKHSKATHLFRSKHAWICTLYSPKHNKSEKVRQPRLLRIQKSLLNPLSGLQLAQPQLDAGRPSVQCTHRDGVYGASK